MLSFFRSKPFYSLFRNFPTFHNTNYKVKALSLRKKHEDGERLKKKIHTQQKACLYVCTASNLEAISFIRLKKPRNVYRGFGDWLGKLK